MEIRKLPCALEEPVKADPDRLEKDGVIKKVEHSEWAPPIVVMHKPNGKVRICGYYHSTINLHISSSSIVSGLEIDDIFSKVGKCSLFSKIRARRSHWCLDDDEDDDSNKLTVISTPFGLYWYLSLPESLIEAAWYWSRNSVFDCPDLLFHLCLSNAILDSLWIVPWVHCFAGVQREYAILQCLGVSCIAWLR